MTICVKHRLCCVCVSAGTGNTVIEAVRVLIEHRVQPKHIILLSLFSTPHGNTAAHSLPQPLRGPFLY